MTTSNQPTREERETWLVEYQACEQESNSNALSYWTLAGIFIGLSSILLGGLIYSIVANIEIFTTIGVKDDAFILRIIILIFGLAMLFILVFLWLWLKRTNYLMDINYARMREIELRLGMCKSLRVLVLDKWNKVRRKLGFKTLNELSDDNINEIWQKTLKGKKEGEELAKGLSEESLGLLADRQEELFELCYRYKLQHCYESPSRNLHFPAILIILMLLWLLTILGVWLPNMINCISNVN